MSPIDLSPFLAVGGDREYLTHPLPLGTGTAASNGHLFVWINDPAPASLSSAMPTSTADRLRAVLSAAQASAEAAGPWVAATEVRIEDRACRRCDGLGSLTATACGECEGDGYFYRGRHEYECMECEGSGEIAKPGLEGFACEACSGSRLAPGPSSIGGGGLTIQNSYILKLRTLPDCQILDDVVDGMFCFCFRFVGGVGAVMALTAPPLAAPDAVAQVR
jgi:hypothetical protein